MPQWLIILLVFIFGLLFNYIFQILDLTMNKMANNQALSTTKVQQEIDKLSGGETPELMPAIGFQMPQDYYEEEYQEEENKI